MKARNAPPGLGEPAPGAERFEAVVPSSMAGERLDKALAALCPQLSRTRARKVIAMGGVYLGDQRCRVAGRQLRPGDLLTATWHPEVKAAPSYPLDVLGEDDAVVVVCKPAGQLVGGTELGDEGSLIRQLARRYGPEIRLMHRLDAATSGVMVAARGPEASAHLTPQFREHTITRRYLAITAVAPPDGDCNIPLVKDGRLVRPARPGEAGMAARTTFSAADAEPRPPGAPVLVRAQLHTGRTHQIRVHLRALGAPIFGDRKYGGPRAPRLCLHAAMLAFEHPDGRRLTFERPPSPDFWKAAGLEPPADLPGSG